MLIDKLKFPCIIKIMELQIMFTVVTLKSHFCNHLKLTYFISIHLTIRIVNN